MNSLPSIAGQRHIGSFHITLQPMHPSTIPIGIAGATLSLREAGRMTIRSASSKGLKNSQKNGILTWPRDHLKNDPRPRTIEVGKMERTHEISIFGKRTEKLLNAARLGDMKDWKLFSSPDTPLRIWKIRDRQSGLIITAYQHENNVRIVDDLLRDVTIAGEYRHAVTCMHVAVV